MVRRGEMGIQPDIFREYDIRGVVERDFAGDVPELIGRAFGSELIAQNGDAASPPVVVVGRDNRPSSPDLAESLIEGLLRTGVDVIDVGTVPTPGLYYATHRYDTDGGIQITGSHNPPEYNGFKMSIGG